MVVVIVEVEMVICSRNVDLREMKLLIRLLE